MKTIILASGAGRRWQGHGRKELALIDGERCIERIVRQSERHTDDVITVTHVPQIRNVVPHPLEVLNRTWKTETLLTLLPHINEDIMILLGDVIYSEAAIKVVYQERQVVTFFGDGGELFAIFVPLKGSYRFTVALQVAQAAAEAKPESYEEGNLWNVYRAFMGKPTNPHFTPPRDSENFVYIEDWTNDIDLPIDYKVFCRDVIDTGLLDDRGER